MNDFKVNLKTVESLLKIARIYDEYSTCEDLYCFLGISNRKAASDEIKAIIGKKKKYFQGQQSNAKWGKLAVEFVSAQRAIDSIFPDNRNEYDNYLIDCKARELRKHFTLLTKRDRELSSNEKQDLIEEGKELGLSERKVIDLINEWLIEDQVKEVAAPTSYSASSVIPFDTLLNKTYYEILGVSEDADYAQIKAVHDKEHKKYIDARDKVKANARWVLVSQAWECLENPKKRKKYDEERKEPPPHPPGVPVLDIESDTDYTFKDVHRGTILTEKIVIKNTEGGLLQGTITSDAAWLEPERNKILEKHEQDLTIEILTSKIPRGTFTVQGNITISSNAVNVSNYIIPFKVILEDYRAEIKRFQSLYVPLAAALFGFLGSFATGKVFVDFAYIVTIGFALWFAIQRIEAEGIKDSIAKIKLIGLAILISLIGGSIVFRILAMLSNSVPHFVGFLLWAYMVGSLTYLLSKQLLEASQNIGVNLLKYSSAIIRTVAAGLVLVSIFVHLKANPINMQSINTIKSSISFPPFISPTTNAPLSGETSKITVTRSLVCGKLDSKNNPNDIRTYFPAGERKLYYYINYTGANRSSTMFEYQWIKDGYVIHSGKYRVRHNSGYAWYPLVYNFQPGEYAVKLYINNQEVNKTNFTINNSTEIVSQTINADNKSLPSSSSIQASLQNITGDWQGKVGYKSANLAINQSGDQLTGTITYDGIKEDLSGEIENHNKINLRGTNYIRLKGSGNFSLDTFTGEITKNGNYINGNYMDKANARGKWYVRKKEKQHEEKTVVTTLNNNAGSRKSMMDNMHKDLENALDSSKKYSDKQNQTIDKKRSDPNVPTPRDPKNF